MTQPSSTLSGHPAVAAVQNASRAAVAIAIVIVALIGTDAAVAVHRTAGSPHSAAAPAGPVGPTTAPTPSGTATPTSPPSSSQTPAPSSQQALKSLLAKAFADALAQHTVHSYARDVDAKSGTAIFDDDDAVDGGIQRITIHGGHIQIRVVGSTTYFTGDRQGLRTYFDFSNAEVTALGKQWIPLTSGQAGYKPVTAGVTIASMLKEDRIIGQLRREAEKPLDGQQVFGISGRATGAGAPHHAEATLWISTTTGLPVEFDAANGDQQLTQTFTDWGKPIPLHSPADVAGQSGLSS